MAPQPAAPSPPPVAEVIESSTRHVVAEVLRGQEAPPFGSWVEIEAADGTVLYGLVSHAETGSVEPGRQAVALGRSRDDLRREMPHVFELIRTTFRAVVLGYWDGRSRTAEGEPRVLQTLPPRPAALHDFVRCCAPDAVARLGAPYDFLRSLATFPDPAVPADDLLAAVLRGLRRAHGEGDAGRRAVLDAGRALARLLHDDHERLQSILRRV
ncbi:MAG TPA: HAS-barrel domain-containing protein [Rubricoccaceae bacterium]|nr:HAS-barrel domain-containing protein [Rubricoccaceae bacterium]